MSSAQLDVAVNGSNSLQWGAISDDTETARLDHMPLFILSSMILDVKRIIQHRSRHHQVALIVVKNLRFVNCP